LAPFLAELAGRELVEAPPIPGAVRVEREVGGTEAQIGSPER
jgi:hypothetical protein